MLPQGDASVGLRFAHLGEMRFRFCFASNKERRPYMQGQIAGGRVLQTRADR